MFYYAFRKLTFYCYYKYGACHFSEATKCSQTENGIESGNGIVMQKVGGGELSVTVAGDHSEDGYLAISDDHAGL